MHGSVICEYDVLDEHVFRAGKLHESDGKVPPGRTLRNSLYAFLVHTILSENHKPLIAVFWF